MKVKLAAALTASFFLLTASMAMAGFKPPKLPDAPPEYQKMKNPYKPKKKSIVKDGEKWYKRKCKKCHGEEGDGKGSAAEDNAYESTDFTKPGYLKSRSDGQLFFMIKAGSKGTDMEAFGEGSETNISDDDIWKIITFMRKEFTK